MTMRMFLWGVLGLFVAILVTLYLVARAANPIMLDEQGRPITHAETSRP